jgi:asparagine synthase (glutamine-hydrolysing)
MDSGSVASVAGWLIQQRDVELPSPLRAYCWAFEDLLSCDERHISDGIAHHFGLSVTNVPGDFAWPLQDYPAHGPDLDDPFIWPYQPLIERTLAAAQSEGTILVMSGDRGDEMVGDWVYDFLGLLQTGQWRTLLAELQACRQQNRMPWHRIVKRYLILPYMANLTRGGWPQKHIFKRPHLHRSEPAYPDWIPLTFAQRIGLKDILTESKPSGPIQDLARRQRFERIFSYSGVRLATLRERTHARFGLGFADPWSDQRLARFILSVPQWLIQHVREPKRVVRQAMRNIMPETVRQAPSSITPEALFDRGLRDRAQLTVRGLMKNSRAVSYGYLDSRALQDAYEAFLSRASLRHDMWFPLTFEMWLRQHWD